MHVKDPVCGMAIDSEKAHASEVYKGTTYFLCSDQCHRQFLAAPERYADATDTHAPPGSPAAGNR